MWKRSGYSYKGNNSALVKKTLKQSLNTHDVCPLINIGESYIYDMETEITNENNSKPNLHKRLFWDWRYDQIDWQKSYRSIIERVLERGTKEEWEEIIRFYGRPRIITALKEEIKFLPDYAIDAASSYFNIRKEEMACFVRKQLRKGHWI